MRISPNQLVLVVIVVAGNVCAQSRDLKLVGSSQPSARPMLVVPMDAINAEHRGKVAAIIKKPTVLARAVPEEFEQGLYPWLLEHPDRASLAWRRLGVPCAEITDRGQGVFGWSDNSGTEVSWRTVAKSDTMRVWLAEGHTKLGPLLPTIPIHAVVVLHSPKTIRRDGLVVIAHSTDIYLQTESRATAMIAKTLGSAAPQLAEQGAGQLLLFFSGLTRYFNIHPDDVDTLLAAQK